MKIIPPSKISGEIFQIIDEADEFLILVSPYIQISGWPKLTSRLKSILNKGVRFRIYIRDGQDNLNSIDELQKLGITPFLIPNLHSKLYLNEKGAVTTSMNLLRSSDQHSLEIGHKTQTEEEYNDIVSYYKRYVFPYEENISDFDTTLEDEIYQQLIDEFPKLKINSNYKSMQINTGDNRFDITIEKETQKYHLKITSILSRSEFNHRMKLTKNYQFSEELGIKFVQGDEGTYDLAVASSQNLDSKQISKVLNSEKAVIADLITSFIKNIESFKSSRIQNN